MCLPENGASCRRKILTAHPVDRSRLSQAARGMVSSLNAGIRPRKRRKEDDVYRNRRKEAVQVADSSTSRRQGANPGKTVAGKAVFATAVCAGFRISPEVKQGRRSGWSRGDVRPPLGFVSG